MLRGTMFLALSMASEGGARWLSGAHFSFPRSKNDDRGRSQVCG